MEIHLHDAKAGCMSWSMVDVYPWRQLQEFAAKGLPVEVESQIMRQIHSEIVLRRH